jgi:hypothetical protein
MTMLFKAILKPTRSNMSNIFKFSPVPFVPSAAFHAVYEGFFLIMHTLKYFKVNISLVHFAAQNTRDERWGFLSLNRGRIILYFAILISASATQVSARSNSVIIPRSQSFNAARELVGWQQFINRADTNGTYGALAFTAEYEQTFGSARLMQFLFDGDIILSNKNAAIGNTISFCPSGCNDTAQLRIQGSCVSFRTPQAWLADYFGLSPDFDSTVFFKPTIQQALFDIDAYIGLDAYTEGLYVRFHAPLVWTKWRMGSSEVLNTNPSNPTFAAGYMSSTTLTGLRTSFLSAMDGTYTFGDLKEPLLFGKFCQGALSTTSCAMNNTRGCTKFGLSDIEWALGYNFLSCEDFHYGVLARGSLPTGNKPNSTCLFEPIVGNGKFWTLGGGLTAHGVLWRDCQCPDRTVSFYLDANITHLFSSHQRRSFDLVGLPNSRYALIEEFANPSPITVSNAVAASFNAALFSTPAAASLTNATQPDKQYTGNLFYLINKSTFDVQASYTVQGDMAFKFSYADNGLDIDIGYELWARSREKIMFCAGAFPSNTYALKGDAFMYGYTAANSATLGANSGNAVRLSATESDATIHSGTNNAASGGPCNSSSQINPNIDAPQFALFGLNGGLPASTTDQLLLAPGALAGNNQQSTSNQPIFISTLDLDTESTTRALTQKLFINISYAWDCDCLSPFFGIGGEIEFAPFTSGSCTNTAGGECCNLGPTCNINSGALSQWGIWLKGGLAFE